MRARIALHQHVATLRRAAAVGLQGQGPVAIGGAVHAVLAGRQRGAAGAQLGGLGAGREHRRGGDAHACAGRGRCAQARLPIVFAGQHHEAQLAVLHRQGGLPLRRATAASGGELHRQQRALGQDRRFRRGGRAHLRELLRRSGQLFGNQFGRVQRGGGDDETQDADGGQVRQLRHDALSLAVLRSRRTCRSRDAVRRRQHVGEDAAPPRHAFACGYSQRTLPDKDAMQQCTPNWDAGHAATIAMPGARGAGHRQVTPPARAGCATAAPPPPSPAARCGFPPSRGSSARNPD
ncbi:hypothetical protein NB706_003431 [Xanthomonas sacchari]|nr:hypothetical protein [Xanthomonas sacchari]